METFFIIAAAALIITFLIGMVRVCIGPSAGDRLLSLQLIGTTSAALLLILSNGGEYIEMVDIALIFALLAPITSAAFLVISRLNENRNAQ